MQANKFGRSGVGDRVRDGGRGTNGGPSPQKTEGNGRQGRWARAHDMGRWV